MMLAVHDIAEINAGDHHAWRPKLKNKTKLERTGLKKLVKNLPQKQQKEILSLWEEYEAKKTPEAKFAKAVDKLETIDQHNLADIKTWNKKEYSYNFDHGQEEVKYSKTLQAIKDLIDKETKLKIGNKIQK
jgi:putative hydrolase of HD superfamily